MKKKIIEMNEIYKAFDGSLVLQGASFDLLESEVHAIVGENGSGKSTLVNILAGIYPVNSGTISLFGEEVIIKSPNQVKKLGINIIFQDSVLLDNMNIAQNIFLNQECLYNLKGIKVIDWTTIYEHTNKVLAHLNLDLDPTMPARMLTVAERKMIEIARSIVNNARVLIFDEPTASFNEQEVEFLFKTIRKLKESGISIIYISHRLSELSHIADRITVLRDGKSIATTYIDEVTREHLIRMMIGDKIKDRYPKMNVPIGREVMNIKGLCFKEVLKDVSFSLRKGEILGISGLKGSGKTILAKVLFGIEHMTKGSVFIEKDKIDIRNSEDAVRNGLCYVANDRLVEGIMPDISIKNNILVTNLASVCEYFLINAYSAKTTADKYYEMLHIKGASIESNASHLSAGNQKKLMLAKWLFRNSMIFIVNEPTSGIDVGSKIDIYNILNSLVKSGASIILISSEIPEIVGLSDRILVMFEGRVVKELARNEATQSDILKYASGDIS